MDEAGEHLDRHEEGRGDEADAKHEQPRPVHDLWTVAVAALVGFVGNEVVGRYRVRVGRRIGSAALVADGLHARTDGLTSLADLLGAGGVVLGWQVADPIVGLVITVTILGAARSAVRQVGSRLLDAVDPHLVDQATSVVAAMPGVTWVAELRMRWVGHTLRAEVDDAVDPSLSLSEAREVAHHVERHLLRKVGRLTAATILTSPDRAHPCFALVGGTHLRQPGTTERCRPKRPRARLRTVRGRGAARGCPNGTPFRPPAWFGRHRRRS